MIDPTLEIRALHDMAEHVLLSWLAVESPTDRRRQMALELLADAGQLLHSACVNLETFSRDRDQQELTWDQFPRHSFAMPEMYDLYHHRKYFFRSFEFIVRQLRAQCFDLIDETMDIMSLMGAHSSQNGMYITVKHKLQTEVTQRFMAGGFS